MHWVPKLAVPGNAVTIYPANLKVIFLNFLQNPYFQISKFDTILPDVPVDIVTAAFSMAFMNLG